MFMHPRCDICRGFGERDANELFGFDLEDKVHTKKKKKAFRLIWPCIAHFQGTGKKGYQLNPQLKAKSGFPRNRTF